MHLTICDAERFLELFFYEKFTFEFYLRSLSSFVAQKMSLLRTSLGVLRDQSILRDCFDYFILPAWSAAPLFGLRLVTLILSF